MKEHYCFGMYLIEIYRTNAPSVLIFSSFSTCFHYPAPVIVGDKNNKKVAIAGSSGTLHTFFPFHVS